MTENHTQTSLESSELMMAPHPRSALKKLDYALHRFSLFSLFGRFVSREQRSETAVLGRLGRCLPVTRLRAGLGSFLLG